MMPAEYTAALAVDKRGSARRATYDADRRVLGEAYDVEAPADDGGAPR